MDRSKIIFEQYDCVGNCLYMEKGDTEDKKLFLAIKENGKMKILLRHSIVDGRMKTYLTGERTVDDTRYAEFYFFIVRDGGQNLIVTRGETTYEIPSKVILDEGTFLGTTDETMDKKIYLDMERLYDFQIK